MGSNSYSEMVFEVEAGDLPTFAAALRRTLDGGPALLALPGDTTQAARLRQAMRPELGEQPGTLIIATSGSTGSPKGVRLSAAAIRASAAATAARLGGPGTWHLALPAQHIAGAMVVARALLDGTEVATTRSDLADLSPAAGHRNYLSLVPTQAQRALAEPSVLRRLTAFDAVLLGGAAASAQLLGRLRDHGVPVVTTYGSSETCGGCVYDGLPLAGVEVVLESDSRIRIAGPMIFDGYRNDAVETEQALCSGEFRTRDRGDFRDGRLRVLGRIDEVIISGGVNVDLAEVQRAVDAADLGQTIIVGIPDPEWGVCVGAVTSQPITLTELRARLADTLTSAALPHRLARTPRIPTLATGKPDRQRVIADWPTIETERL